MCLQGARVAGRGGVAEITFSTRPDDTVSPGAKRDARKATRRANATDGVSKCRRRGQITRRSSWVVRNADWLRAELLVKTR